MVLNVLNAYDTLILDVYMLLTGSTDIKNTPGYSEISNRVSVPGPPVTPLMLMALGKIGIMVKNIYRLVNKENVKY